ncbi:hypothetical protein [Wolbachia endosymbiont (group A) of Longitarsus flavicornis]|uniref:hypothetical protein n=1 Tax=Wolbachia endosymbiont (group A) of Longitarsus flavicornis TaxID=3066134 RepID=UPI0030CA35BA
MWRSIGNRCIYRSGIEFYSFITLVIGGIVGSITPALIAAFCAVALLCKFCTKDPIEKDNKENTLLFVIGTLASAAIGVGLAAAATAIFPGAMLGMGSAALAGATIGVIAPIAGLFATMAIIFAAEKVNEYIISPIVECFSSKEKGYESL